MSRSNARLLLYKVVDRSHKSPLASGEYKHKYKMRKWQSPKVGRFFCFRELEDAVEWAENVFANSNNYCILKCDARREETVYEMEASEFINEEALQGFYSDNLKDWGRRHIASKQGMAFPLRIRPFAEVK